MKLLSSLILLSFFSIQITKAQSDDIPVDESLIIRLADVATGGYLSRTAIPKATVLEVNEDEATIVSFEYICEKTGSEARIHNDGPELNDEILAHLKGLKIGSKISFENIRIENASGEVLARPLKITIKS